MNSADQRYKEILRSYRNTNSLDIDHIYYEYLIYHLID